ncbi:threonine/serine dehydratase [Candidatus Raskinella chloraquaticus]|uniref:Threonine dehydratase n=1 Tax=Candidatus Raskinella chloraquaticus TaxID=1951219 RepID=A0A1W9HYY9_9HYPH|nr:MAG: threonine dehydratase [Proteobacteria bacterium SG_bin8]
MITLADIRSARQRVTSHIRTTPVLADTSTGALLKLEFLQHSGSFKARGAFNNLLSQTIPEAGVAAASGGNHGAAVALAAQRLGLKAKIFVPEISSPAKIARIRACGAAIVIGGASYADAAAACDLHVKESGALPVHAYDSWATIAGQGTLGAEWEEQSPQLDTVLVAAGGGGLIAGIARWFERRVKVVGVEPQGSCALHASLKAGRPVDVAVSSIAADSLGARNCGQRVLAVAERYVDHVVLVDDEAIRQTQNWLWREMRIVAEPGGAAALAALQSGGYRPAQGERVGVLLCGANTDPSSVV